MVSRTLAGETYPTSDRVHDFGPTAARRGSGEERGGLPRRLHEPLSKGLFRGGQRAGITICMG